MNRQYDYIIVGSGAGGSAAAYHLARTGKRVLLLEKGGPLPLDGSTLDVAKVFRQGVFRNREPWLDKDGCTLVPQEYFNVGGKTKWYGAALLRFGAGEFEADNNHQCLPWPISYQDLAPYYDEAETLLGVREFEPEPNLRAILTRLQRNGGGWKAQPLPLGLAAEILQHPEEAKHFDAFASVKGLKADAEHALLDRVRGRANLHILTDAPVRTLLADADPRRITGVVCEDGREFRGAAVVLAAGAMHSPRILQRHVESASLGRRLPNGDLIGRYYKCHLNSALLAFSPGRKSDVLRKTVLFLNERFPHSSVQTLGWMDGEIVGSQLPGYAPRWFADFMGERVYGFWLTTEDGSSVANRILSRVNGSEHPQLDYDWERLPPAVEEHAQLARAFRWALLRCGLVGAVKLIQLEGTAHACGTLVTGNDPAASVVDAHGRVHGMDNLYVVDGSILPRSSRVNPSLTIYAWALRVAHHLEPKGQPS